LRVSGADVPMPYSKPLEEIAFPHEPDVVRAALSVCAGQGAPR
jgi:pyruvate/2-oxoglutarate/acetoin dehydrogenase E1 component